MNSDVLPVELWLPGMMAMLCLVAASGFFSASETALFYLSHEELRTMRVGSAGDRLAAALMRHPDRLLTAILFWNLVINLAYFATSVVVARQLLQQGFAAGAGFFGLASLFGIIVFGEVLPKSMAVVFRRRLSSLVSFPLAVAVRVLDPITPVLGRLTVIARRTFWPHLQREPVLEADDLERAVEASELSADVIEQERQVLHNILDLSEMTAEEIMRPRGTYVALPPPISLADLGNRVPESGYVMVLEEGTEDIEQAVPLLEFSDIPATGLEQAAEDVVYVPWCAPLADVFQTLRDRFCGVAVVVNEYGETIGIVTYEDILDTIFSAQPSRAKRILQREPVLEVAPDTYHVEGMTTLRYLSHRLGLDYEPADDGVYTVAGLLQDELEHLPRVGDECQWRGYRLRVISADNLRRMKVLVTPVSKPSSPPEASFADEES